MCNTSLSTQQFVAPRPLYTTYIFAFRPTFKVHNKTWIFARSVQQHNASKLKHYSWYCTCHDEWPMNQMQRNSSLCFLVFPDTKSVRVYFHAAMCETPQCLVFHVYYSTLHKKHSELWTDLLFTYWGKTAQELVHFAHRSTSISMNPSRCAAIRTRM